MGSGKSRLFKEIYKVAKKYARQKVLTFSSVHDKTCPPKTVHSRDNNSEYLPIDHDVKSLSDVIKHVQDYLDPINLKLSHIEAEYIATGVKSYEVDMIQKSLERKKNIVVLVDEVHFLDKDVTYTQIREYCRQILDLANQGPQFIFFGLDLTWERLPWKTTSLLMGIAKVIDKRTAICRFCHKSGCHYTKCIDPESLNGSYVKNPHDTEEINARKDIFFPACDKCLVDPNKIEPKPIEDEDYDELILHEELMERFNHI